MKKLLISIILTALFAATVHAGQSQSGNPQANAAKGERQAQMRQALGLTDQQVAEMKKIRQNGGSREEVRAVLTEEQRQKMDKMRAEAKSRRAANGADPDAAEGKYQQPARSDNG